LARNMTPAEKQSFRVLFPNLDVDRVVVTGEVSAAYNCIALTVGFTDRWLWPGSSIAHFDTFYHNFGYVRSGNGTIATWGRSLSNITHGCVSGPRHGPRWESKCGGDLQIQHGLQELIGSHYGRIVAFYRKRHSVQTSNAPTLEDSMKEQILKPTLTTAQKNALRQERSQFPAELRAAFDTAFDAWKSTWFSGGLAISSDPGSRAVGKEFDTLIAMGPAVLPLVVEKLVDPESFMALQLYDAIQPDEHLIVQYGPEDERILEGEQGRARRVIQAWLTNR
jgi:hypothetical protein